MPDPGTAILPDIPNLRDVGGVPTRSGGRVRTGLLYRSVDLSRITDAQAAALAALGVRVVYDLRTDDERAIAPDRMPPGADLVVADVMADDTGASPAAFGPILADPAHAERVLGGGRSARFFLERYPAFVTMPSARTAYRRLYHGLARPDGRPGLVHCTTGKDRTGWAVAALLLVLDVPEEPVLEDYLASGPAVAPLMAPAVEEFRARGGDPALLEPLVGVDPAYLAAALEAVREGYGSVRGWFADGLGIDAAGIDALRTAFVEGG
ncbi:MAG: tyrosine-protein phosphatase [Chloroflexi bacterium]|jgi:protein-tyrosine phosphatase|nr:tyrosine-protein phosphatase [Chloroflexota bacterium]